VKTNLGHFLRNDFHPTAGIKCLIESFYRSIVENTPPPIPYREILLTARIMDDIFDQVGSRPSATDCNARLSEGRMALEMGLESR
jgi:hypothetical protein